METVRSLKVPGAICFILATIWIAGWERRLTWEADHGVYPPLPTGSHTAATLDTSGVADARLISEAE